MVFIIIIFYCSSAKRKYSFTCRFNKLIYNYRVGDVDGIWIGYNDQENEGSFVWPNGITNSSYENFKIGEPNNGRHGNCIIMYTAWNDHFCDRAEYFFCQTILQ